MHAVNLAYRMTASVLVPIGRAGPVHACNIGLILSLPRVICPPGAGVASALGFLVSPTAFTFVQGGVVALDDLDFESVRETLDGMQRDGRDLLQKAGTAPEEVKVEYLAAMRYIGQGYNVEARIDVAILQADDRIAIRAAFEDAYRTQYGRAESAMQVEIVSWRVLVSGPKPVIDLVAARPETVSGDACKGERQVYFGTESGFPDAKIYDRYRLAPGAEFDGPAIFEERESTTVVPPGAHARIDEALNLVVDLPSNE